ncbi:hypothetical protein FPV67DRAFT_633962 [Lyophyllum atratum]|nr:hypothetical protein FPV67DRAFT_633962 [Lyophyllum atratum]
MSRQENSDNRPLFDVLNTPQRHQQRRREVFRDHTASDNDASPKRHRTPFSARATSPQRYQQHHRYLSRERHVLDGLDGSPRRRRQPSSSQDVFLVRAGHGDGPSSSPAPGNLMSVFSLQAPDELGSVRNLAHHSQSPNVSALNSLTAAQRSADHSPSTSSFGTFRLQPAENRSTPPPSIPHTRSRRLRSSVASTSSPQQREHSSRPQSSSTSLI